MPYLSSEDSFAHTALYMLVTTEIPQKYVSVTTSSVFDDQSGIFFSVLQKAISCDP